MDGVYQPLTNMLPVAVLLVATGLLNANPIFDATSAVINNPYFPTPFGSKLTYMGYGNQQGANETVDVVASEAVNGIQCLKVMDSGTFGTMSGSAVSWFAQDIEGNLWVLKFQNSNGQQDDRMHLAFPKTFVLGQSVLEGAATVSALDETVTLSTGLGPYQHCLALQTPTKISYLAPEVGRVKVVGPGDGGLELSSLSIPPAISQQPQSLTVARGTTVTFTVVATGSGSLTYQWLFNGSPIPGATATNLVLTNVTMAAAGNYAVTVSNVVGGLTSSNAVLTVVPPTAPTLSNPRLAAGIFTVTVQTQAGPTYTLESVNDLSATNWAAVQSVTGTGVPSTLTDTNATAAARFYRVRTQ